VVKVGIILRGKDETKIRKLIDLLKVILSLKPEECSGCGIWTDGQYERVLTDYKGHRLCGWCVVNWRHRNQLEGRTLLFTEFKNGKLEKNSVG